MACKQTVTRIGGVYNTLIAYPPQIISTESCNPSLQLSIGGGLDTDFKAINYTALQEQTSFCSGRDYPVAGNPNIWSTKAYPFVLSFPPGLDSVDPKWKTCSIFAYGALDPPRTLEEATALVDPGQQGNPSVTADPGARPTPANAPATATPDPPTATSASPNPPARGDPPAGADPPSGVKSPAAVDPSSRVEPPAGQISPIAAQLPPGGDTPPKADPPSGLTVTGIISPDNTINNGPHVTAGPDDPNEDGHRVESAQQGTSSDVGAVQDPDVPDASGKDPTGAEPNIIIMSIPDHTQDLPSIGGTVAHVLPTAGVELAGLVIPPGLQAEISGTGISVGIGNVVIGGSTYAAESQQTPAPVLVGGQQIVASKGSVVIGGSTYLAGAQATISGTPVSVGTGSLVVGGSTYALPSYPTQGPLIIDGNAITRAGNGDVVFHGSTIAPQVQAIIAGHTVSAGVSSVIVDGTSYSLPTPVLAGITQGPAPKAITLVDGAVISAGGSAATISGTTYSIPSDGGELVLNGKTMALSSSIQSAFTVGGQRFTAAPNGFVIDGQSVTLDGPAIIVSGTLVSLGPSGLQIGSSTIPLTPAQQTQDSGLGGLIMSGFGNGGNGASNFSTPLGFTGAGLRSRDETLTTGLVLLGISIGVAAYAM